LLASIGILAIGFLLGMRHATDADHVVAVTTIVSRRASLTRAALIGALWGLGHTMTLLGVGGAMILFKLVMPPWLGLTLELLVALMLVFLGVVSVIGGERGDRVLESNSRPLIVGTIHGMAGSAAFTLLALPLIASSMLAAGYLILFGVGTIAGMVVVTMAVALPSLFAARRMDGARRTLRLAAGCASIGFGLYLAHRIGFVDGLFTSAPHWTPR
jgi:high-affinity nickel-transport protein